MKRDEFIAIAGKQSSLCIEQPSHLEPDTRVTLFSLIRKHETSTQGQSLESAFISQAMRNQKGLKFSGCPMFRFVGV